MAPHHDRHEIEDAVRREKWSLYGPNRLVKVVPTGSRVGLPAKPAYVSGYFTLARFLRGMTPLMIEKALGLKPESLFSGAVVYRLTRFPLAHEYDYELTADHPGGLGDDLHEQ